MKNLARSALLGLLLGSIAYTCFRIHTAQFPLDLVAAELLILPLLGLVLGLTRGLSWFTGPRSAWTGLLVLGVFYVSMMFNRGVSLHHFVSQVYYPYPSPGWPIARLSMFVVSWISESLFFGWLSAQVLDDSSNRRPRRGTEGAAQRTGAQQKSSASALIGAAAGFPIGLLLVLTAGAHMALALLLAVALLVVLPPALRSLALLFPAVTLVADVVIKDALLTWRATDVTIMEKRWSPYYYLNFISLRDNRCMGGVYSYLMLWQTCENRELMQRELRYFHGLVGKNKSSALVIGRVDGTTALTLESTPGQMKNITMVEIDPLVVDRLKGRYARYNGNLTARPGVRMVAADWRTFMEKDSERYDVLVLDGLGIGLYPYPLTNIPQEGLLYTREAFELAFNKRLRPDGVLAFNWGSTVKEELYPLVANFPKDVHRAAYWMTFSSYPFTGLPLFLVAASRDKSRIDAIREGLRDVDPFKEIELPTDLSAHEYTDDAPFAQRRIYMDGAHMMRPFGILLLIGLALLVRGARREGTPRVALLASRFTKGLLLALATGWHVSRHAHHAIPWGPGPALVFLFFAFFAALGLGAVAFGNGRNPRVARWLPLSAPVVLGLLSLAASEGINAGFNFLILVFVQSPGLLAPKTEETGSKRAAAGSALGFAFGLYLLQELLLHFGYKTTGRLWAAGHLLASLLPW